MANVYPPSPALSACDSLADIEDLDAFLEAQGKLSHWPTPPPAVEKTDVVVETRQTEDLSLSEDSDDEDDGELWRLASVFTHIADEDPSHVDIDHVLMILLRADVPPEVLALAYSILRVVANQKCDGFPICDLAVAACLSLATTFVEDQAPDAEYWARRVCKKLWTAQQIDMCVLDFLAHPDLQMLTLSSEVAITETMIELRDIALGVVDEAQDDDESTSGGDAVLDRRMAPEPLKLSISTTAQWVHGVITPAETPIAETNNFLRLL